ncbi:hypothetical protein BDV93DRAFT_603451 [Ceratobasidium sp. AG-I]|nr:hypothetical protein BDV93DRAFT_603451 [Ceratobasidium sp. AG-I]
MLFSIRAELATTSVDPARAYRKWQQQYYPKELWWAVGCFIAIITLLRLISLANASWTKRSARSALNTTQAGDEEKSSIPSVTSGTPGNGSAAYRRIPSATLSSAQLILFRTRLPFHRLHHLNVAETLVSIGYLAALLTWGFISSPNLTVTYWANRAAHLATSQTPLIVALAGKNNIVTLITGIGYEKLNVLHRASARSTLILIWVHAFGRWKLGLAGHFSLDEVDMRFGVVAMVAFTLAAILSIRPIRNMAYEFFLIAHIVLVAMYLIFGLFHVPEVKFRFWPALAIWALDRLLRALRLVVLNRLWLNIFPTGNTVDQASVERVSDDTVRLTVRRNLNWSSGQHAFIIAPSVARFPLEAHPFTIASAYKARTNANAEESNKHDLVFIIRARDGFTKRLLEASDKRQTIPVYVDGPYGAPPSLSHYTTCILFAGGSGVSYTLPLLIDLARQVQLGNAVARRALFVWVVRDRSHVAWISNLLLEAVQSCPSTLELDIRIHVTQHMVNVVLPNASTPSMDAMTPVEDKSGNFEKSSTSLSHFESVKVVGGRPDIHALIDEEISCSTGRVSVDVSGPSSLADGVRGALVSCESARPSAVLRGTPRATLHVETFGW